MKRASNLLNHIADYHNLYHAYCRAARGKHSKTAVKEYIQNLDLNITNLRQGLLSGNLNIGNYHYFKISDPKQRTICAAAFNERVLHHALMLGCHSVFERHLITDTYATRLNKGTFAAIDRAAFFAKTYLWFAKLDVRKYFDNILHSQLKQQLNQLFKDRAVIEILHSIIDSYQTTQGRGIPIGNLSSQYFANHYLSAADHYAKETLHLQGYVRYMDDIVLFHNQKETLLECVQKFTEFLATHLGLQLKEPCISLTQNGLPFLGFRIFPHTIKLNHQSKKRFRRKYRCFEKNLRTEKWSESEYQKRVLPLFAFVQHADTKSLRKKYIFAFEG